MSLINDALKRAKQETIRREAAEKGVPLAAWPHPPARRSWMAMVILVLVAALASSLTGLVLVSRNSSEQVVPAKIVQVAPPSQPAPVSEPIISTPPPAKATPPSPPSTDTARQPVVAEEAATSSPASPEPIAPEPSVDGSTVEVVSPITPPPADPQESEQTEPKGPVYAHRVELPGGVTFELGGIAWSEYGPVALLNGRAVGRGERVEGYLIVEIEPEQIELRGDTGTIFLRLK